MKSRSRTFTRLHAEPRPESKFKLNIGLWFSSAYSVAFLKKDVNKYMHIYHRSFSPKLNTRRNAIELKNNLFFSYVFWPF